MVHLSHVARHWIILLHEPRILLVLFAEGLNMFLLMLALVVPVFMAESGWITVTVLLQLRKLRHTEQRFAHGWVTEVTTHFIVCTTVAWRATAPIVATSCGRAS